MIDQYVDSVNWIGYKCKRRYQRYEGRKRTWRGFKGIAETAGS
jgi:hypothetical protein